jgi:hypothetical protein
LRNVRNITKTADKTSSWIADDFLRLRENIKASGFGLALLANIFKSFRGRKKGKKGNK